MYPSAHEVEITVGSITTTNYVFVDIFYFKQIMKNIADSWIRSPLPEMVYCPIWQGEGILNPIMQDHSEERPITGVNFFRRS